MIFLSQLVSFNFSNDVSLWCLAALRTHGVVHPVSACPLPAEGGRLLHPSLIALASGVGPAEVLGAQAIGQEAIR